MWPFGANEGLIRDVHKHMCMLFSTSSVVVHHISIAAKLSKVPLQLTNCAHHK